jgi:hypothetical protein
MDSWKEVRGKRIDARDAAVIAGSAGLAMQHPEQLREVVARQVGVDDFDGTARRPGPDSAQHFGPHLNRGSAIRTPHVRAAERPRWPRKIHSGGGVQDHRRSEIDDLLGSGGRLGIIAIALHGHEAGRVHPTILAQASTHGPMLIPRVCGLSPECPGRQQRRQPGCVRGRRCAAIRGHGRLARRRWRRASQRSIRRTILPARWR